MQGKHNSSKIQELQELRPGKKTILEYTTGVKVALIEMTFIRNEMTLK